MPLNLRKFARYPSNSFCLIEADSALVKALFVDYSQVGALLRVEQQVPLKKQLALIYPTERSKFVKMAGYSVHLYEKDGIYYLGVQFIALMARSA